jgi:hypothetical protein
VGYAGAFVLAAALFAGLVVTNAGTSRGAHIWSVFVVGLPAAVPLGSAGRYCAIGSAFAKGIARLVKDIGLSSLLLAPELMWEDFAEIGLASNLEMACLEVMLAVEGAIAYWVVLAFVTVDEGFGPQVGGFEDFEAFEGFEGLEMFGEFECLEVFGGFECLEMFGGFE